MNRGSLDEDWRFDYTMDDTDSNLDISTSNNVTGFSTDQVPVTDVPDDSSVSVYLASCQEEHLLPFSSVTRGLYKPFLQLKYQSIGCRAMKPLSIALVCNHTVTVLDLEDSDVGHQGCFYLSQTFKQNITIKHLNLANNSIGNDGIADVVKTLCKHTTLTYLNISGNKLTDTFGSSLAQLLKENTTIVRLCVGYNCLRRQSAEAVGQGMGVNQSLEHLDLSWNAIPGSGAGYLFHGIKKNCVLKTLDLSCNGIGYEGGQALAGLLNKNRHLKYVDVTNTRIMWQNMSAVGSALKHNQTLEVLKMGRNPLTSTGAMSLLEGVASDKCILRLLDLTDVPVVAEFHVLAAAIQSRRYFKFIHGGIVNSHDYLGRQVLGNVLGKSGITIQHPMQILIDFVRIKQIRLLELFRSMDKAALMKMSDKNFIDRLKRFGFPMNQNQTEGLAKAISRKGPDRSEITYPKLVRSVADHILRVRTNAVPKDHIDSRREDIDQVFQRVSQKNLGSNQKKLFPPLGGISLDD